MGGRFSFEAIDQYAIFERGVGFQQIHKVSDMDKIDALPSRSDVLHHAVSTQYPWGCIPVVRREMSQVVFRALVGRPFFKFRLDMYQRREIDITVIGLLAQKASKDSKKFKSIEEPIVLFHFGNPQIYFSK